MGFSFRSFFGKGGSGHGTAEAPVNTMSPPLNMNVPVSPFHPAPGVGESPFANSLLFKSNSPAAPLGQPVQSAPFNPFAPMGAAASAGLTVGDILPALPPDIAKNPGLSPMQAIVLPDAVLENALRSGRGSVPIFELFQACKNLFQMPVSPHDPREVPLPPGKISQLLSAKSHQPANDAPPANSSPFGFGAHLAAAQQSPGSPFGMNPAKPSAAAPVEPIYQPSPFSIAASQPDAAFPVAPQNSPAQKIETPFTFPAPPNPAGNLAPANHFFTAPAPTAPSPFTFAQAAPVESHAPEVAPCASVAAPESSNFTAAKPDGFFGANFATHEPAKPESGMFGMPAEIKNSAAVQGTGGFLAEVPAPSPMAPSAFESGITGETNPFFSAPVTGKEISATLPPVPAMLPELGRPEHIEKTAEHTPSFSAPAATPLTNPFARIQALAKSKETTSAPPVAFTPPAMPEPPAFGTGFLNPEPASAFTAPEPVIERSSPSIFESLGLPTISTPEPVSESVKAIVSPKANEPEVIKLGLAASLKNCAADDLGTPPEHIPSWVQFSLPVDSIRSQLATGRVTVPFSSILQGLEPEVRGIFAKARPALMVELESNEVFHALTSNTAPSAEPVAPVSAAQPEEAARPTIDPFASMPPQNQWVEAPANKEAETRFWADLPTAAIPSTLFTLAQADPAPAEPLKSDMPEEMSHEVAAEFQEPVFIPANPVTGTPEFTSIAPLPPRRAPVTVTPARSDDQTRRLMLAVLLGTSDVPDAGVFATLTRRLPGVSAVLCMQQDQVVAADGDETCEAERFLREAPLKMRMLPSLTALTGIEDTETLHIQSGQGEATFCLQGSVTLAVLHDPRRREPVLKEKITLLGRELAAMLSANPPA